MPKISLGLQDAKAKDAEILAKLAKVQQAAQGSKQKTKLNQQRLEYAQLAHKLATEARRHENDLQEAAAKLPVDLAAFAEDRRAGDEYISDVWFQVAGVRKLLAQVKMRDEQRLRKAPEQALSLQNVLSSVVAALSGQGRQLAEESARLEEECSAARRSLLRDLGPEAFDAAAAAGVAGRRSAADGAIEALSDEEDALVEQLGGAGVDESYGEDLARLNDQVKVDLAQLDQELSDLRRRRTGWDDEANFRFASIRQQFQGRPRELLVDRLQLEFPHLSREQLQAHESHCDALKYAQQKQSAALRQWRRDRAALLAKAKARAEDRRRAAELAAERRQSALDQRAKQKQLQVDLQMERARALPEREERRRQEEEERRRRDAAQAEKDNVQNRRAREAKELSKQYNEQRREQRRREEEEAHERARREAEERSERMEENSKRVLLRQQRDELKQREAAQQRAAAEREAQERAMRLQRAIESLRVEAPRDPERLLRQPASWQAPAYNDPLVCVTRGPHAGFDEKRLMSDARYKLSSALEAAGLLNSRAGHEAMARAQAARGPAAPHFVSHVFDTGGGYPAS
eukprot:TRINITY_DN21870_c0_g1_i1.p1 TRINITY_DN21870_c0_g1~~TRINITY_DN21870_c0_g1_i1.p1  ORF type:complete len:576 (-),score=184.68 TRINITY_DN21870_c0_g1_i1:106-1833(-)